MKKLFLTLGLTLFTTIAFFAQEKEQPKQVIAVKGQCEMCKKRIPQEAAVRVTIDPFSKKEVDKATASIAITGDQGEVSYFENETNYRNYIKNLNL